METYEMTALALRYWFIALLCIILLRLAFSILRDRIKQPELTEKTAGYTIGLLEAVYPENTKVFAKRWQLGRENRIGSSSVCEVRIKSRWIRGIHCMITQQGERVMLMPCGGRLSLNGCLVSQPVELTADDYIGMGGILLRVRLAPSEREPRRPRKYDTRYGFACVDESDYDDTFMEYVGISPDENDEGSVFDEMLTDYTGCEYEEYDEYDGGEYDELDDAEMDDADMNGEYYYDNEQYEDEQYDEYDGENDALDIFSKKGKQSMNVLPFKPRGKDGRR